MRILLDESLPIEVRSELPGHDVRTVREQGWSGLKNGELLARAADQFEVLLTADRNLQYQQNLSRLPVSVVALTARTNRIDDLRPLIPPVDGCWEVRNCFVLSNRRHAGLPGTPCATRPAIARAQRFGRIGRGLVVSGVVATGSGLLQIDKVT